MNSKIVANNTDWKTLRSQFPVAENFIYFNHAAIAPISLDVKREIDDCMAMYCEKGIVCNQKYLTIANQTRELAAKLINSKPSEIAFVKNTTQGIQLAANGIKWQPGDNVVIPDNEFPANVYPWLNLDNRSVETRFIPLINGKFTPDDVARHIDNRTKAVSVSAVSFTNGFRCDLAGIGRLCHERGIYFIVDAIQALGALEVDVKKCKIDLLSADAHKWLLGPQGIGFAYISETFLENLDVSNLGYRSMINESDYLNYSIRLKPDASRFEEGSLNIFGIVGLKATLGMLLSIGIPTINERLIELIDVIIRNLTQRRYIIKSPLNSNERSGIVSFYHKEIATEAIHQNLIKGKVVCAQRDCAIRISPHFYNNSEDIDAFFKALL